ncbi:stalk domain-containing protein [Dysosmobacter acutus]|nr:stalk domain-containing protein [Dysosmobacter acutus]
MKHLLGKRIMAMVLAAVLTAAMVLPASAVLGQKKNLEVTAGIGLTINGLKAKATDVTGKAVDTFYYDGTTYVPVRAVGEALGQTVAWDSAGQSVAIGTKGNDAANDAAYLSEYFGISRLNGTLSWATYNSALEKIGFEKAAASGTLTAATAAKSLVAAANMTELALTYTSQEASEACKRYGTISAADAPYVACAIEMGLIPNSVDFTAALDGDTASVLLMNAVEASGKGRNYIGFSNDPDIAQRLTSTWNSFTVFDDEALSKLGVEIVSSGATTGYNLKYDGNAARFLSGNTIQYGHDNITHAVQLMGLLNRAGLVARVQLEPKVSVYEYLLEWNDGKMPASTPTYEVRQVADNLYLTYAVEYDLQLEFSSQADRNAFDGIIEEYAKKYDDNPELEGLIYSSWWQPLYSTKVQMSAPQYQQIYDVVVRNGDYTIHPFATAETLGAVQGKVASAASGLSVTPTRIWVNAAFYRYITGTSHQ